MGRYEIEGRAFEDIERQLLFSLTSFDKPHIEVTHANYGARGELYLMSQQNWPIKISGDNWRAHGFWLTTDTAGDLSPFEIVSLSKNFGGFTYGETANI